MKTSVQFALVLLLAFGFRSVAAEDGETAAFHALEVAWSEAIRAQDREALESFLAAEYTLTVAEPGGLSVTDRATWLKNATSVYKVHEFTFKDMVVRRYGDVAIVSSLYNQRATVNGRDRSGDAFLTDIWVKVGGTWKVSARYSSNPKAGPAKVPPGNSEPPRGAE